MKYTFPNLIFPLTSGGGGGGSYVLPIATESTLGGVKAKAKTDENAEIAIDSNAKLWAKVPAQVQSDWNETDTDDPAYIANKPTIPEAYTLPSASTNTLGGVKAESIPSGSGIDVNINGNDKLFVTNQDVQSDWDESDNTKPGYIANKPTIPDVSGKRDLPASVSVHVIDPNTAIGNVAANTVYTCDASLTYLNITAVETSDLESQVWFVAGATAPTVVLPSNVPVIGLTTFKASKGYVISFQNGVAVVGEYDVS